MKDLSLVWLKGLLELPREVVTALIFQPGLATSRRFYRAEVAEISSSIRLTALNPLSYSESNVHCRPSYQVQGWSVNTQKCFSPSGMHEMIQISLHLLYYQYSRCMGSQSASQYVPIPSFLRSQSAKSLLLAVRNVYQFTCPGVEEVEVQPPKAGEVRIKVVACGVCHTVRVFSRSPVRRTAEFLPPAHETFRVFLHIC